MAQLFMQRFIDKRITNYLDRLDLNINIESHIYTHDEYIKQENKTWYNNDKQQLLRFYQINNGEINQLYPIKDFYKLVPGNYPVEHFPLANMISKAMVNLIFSEKPEITIDSGNKKTDQILNKKVLDVYEENQYANLLQKAAEFESYSGAVAFKIIVDPNFSDNPIIMVYPKEDFEIVKKYDRLQAIIFKDHYKKGDTEFILYSEYGKGYIVYKLVSCKNGKQKEVSIDSLDETAGLKDLNFYNMDGSNSDQILAVYKENKTNAKSDYDGITDDFQALDEIRSNIINYIRKSKIITYMPENMCVQDTKSNPIPPSDYYSDYTILRDSSPKDVNMEAKRDIVDIQSSIAGYNNTFNDILKNALMTTGLSPVTIGYDLAGANSSGEALSIREKTSMRTRSEKIHRWDIALKELTKLILSLSDIKSIQDKNYIKDYSNYDVNVSFAEYESPTFDAIVGSLGTALDNGLIDEETALKKLWAGELSEEQILTMEENIKNKFKDKTRNITNALTENALEEEQPDDNEELDENNKD